MGLMDDFAREALEADVRARCSAGDYDGAATAALKGFGAEIFGFLVALHRSETDASDVFSVFSENLWKGIRGFAWACTLRAWAYTVARNASHRFRRGARKHEQGRVPLSANPAVEAVVEQVRTATLTYLKTAQKDKFAAIRETLPVDDQMLLILRVDRELAWDEIARVMLDEEGAGEARLRTESARLRKRFQLVKEKLFALGKKAGLVPDR
jgi:RNA polymerase sigma-70 factor (ECF subfamily)